MICHAHWVGRGKGSGISIDVRQFDLYEFRDGKWISAVIWLGSKDEALDATSKRTAKDQR